MDTTDSTLERMVTTRSWRRAVCRVAVCCVDGPEADESRFQREIVFADKQRAQKDLRKAADLTPEDPAIKKELAKVRAYICMYMYNIRQYSIV